MTTYFTPLPNVETIMNNLKLSRIDAQALLRSWQLMREEIQRKEKNLEKSNWLFDLLILLLILRHRQNLSLNNPLLIGLSNEIFNSNKPLIKPKNKE
ncbi:hypothetical protein [Ferrovum myxofaciens]|uniref:hypothetical protein n=1 Tax=Ferrovum myxofaciens TaxID=416213 RepID=UPI0023577E2B|nr:hypothetical protein [Ferrovum myxofaciens]MBU6994782.1 hypothetical protein [Ferrovum myxofaciens]